MSSRTAGACGRFLVVSAAIAVSCGACTLGPFAAADTGPGEDTGADATLDTTLDVITDTTTDTTADSGVDVPRDAGTDAVMDTIQVDSPPSNYRVVGDGGVVWQAPQLGANATEPMYLTGCPANTVATGLYMVWESVGWGNGGFPRVLQLYCSTIHRDGTLGTATPSPDSAVTSQPSSEFQGLMMGTDSCPTGEVVVGFHGTTVRGVYNQLGIECASLVEWIRDPLTAAIHQLPMHGALNALNESVMANWERSCTLAPAPTVVSRMEGNVGYWFENLIATCIEVAR